jgi:hypothetical protein
MIELWETRYDKHGRMTVHNLIKVHDRGALTPLFAVDSIKEVTITYQDGRKVTYQRREK